MQQPDHEVVGLERGQHVDEPEKPDLEVLVVHGPGHDPARPLPCVERRRRAADGGGELAADRSYFFFEIDFVVHGHNSIMLSALRQGVCQDVSW